MNPFLPILRWAALALTRRLAVRRYPAALPPPPGCEQRLEGIRQAFLAGLAEALVPQGTGAALANRLRAASAPRLRGFRFEGAGMGLRLRERFAREHGLVASFRTSGAEPYRYLVEVGAGWAAALPWASPGAVVEHEESLLQWLRVDGFAFARTLFRWRESEVPVRLARFTEPFAQIAASGVGRALFFRCTGSCASMVARIERWPGRWRSSLYAGCGLAAVYAGGAAVEGLESLRRSAGEARVALAQGAAFAAKARLAGGELAEDQTAFGESEEACRVLTGLGLAEAADITDAALGHLPDVSSADAYQLWRARVQKALAPVAGISTNTAG